jgi:hypothetical protein
LDNIAEFLQEYKKYRRLKRAEKFFKKYMGENTAYAAEFLSDEKFKRVKEQRRADYSNRFLTPKEFERKYGSGKIDVVDVNDPYVNFKTLLIFEYKTCRFEIFTDLTHDEFLYLSHCSFFTDILEQIYLLHLLHLDNLSKFKIYDERVPRVIVSKQYLLDNGVSLKEVKLLDKKDFDDIF